MLRPPAVAALAVRDRLVFALLAGACLLPAALLAQLKSDETVLLFPTYAVPSKDGSRWVGSLRAWVFEPEAGGVGRAAVLKGLAKSLGLDEADAESPVFQERARAFLVDNERGKELRIRAPGGDWVLRSESDGHAEAEVTIPREAAGPGWIELVERPAPQGREPAKATVHLLAPRGTLVISDVDDTIKVSRVRERRALLAHTFLKPFEAVAGMSGRYSEWARAGAAFHYLSASPWQLYPALSEFLAEEGFPEGSIHMKKFRWKDRSFLDLFGGQQSYKRGAILPLVEALPERRVYLVGDSGEQDPEIFGALAREFPQVAGVFIRDTTGEKPDGPRYRTAFQGLAPERWRVFSDPTELPGGL